MLFCLLSSALAAAGCADSDGSGGGLDLGVPDAIAGPPIDGGGDGAATPDLLDVDALSFQQRCWSGFGPTVPRADYDQFHPTFPATHCSGTNQQAITGVERVVFLGDSITVGTPPTAATDLYRGKLAVLLAAKFGIAPPDGIWPQVNLLAKTSLSKTSGAFSSCAKWGARLGDLGSQIGDCFDDVEPKKTLIVFTMGGNDFADFAKEGTGGTPIPTLLGEVDARIATLSLALDRLVDPAHFPAGSYVILTNNYEFTDATGDVPSCLAAVTAGLGASWPAGAPVFLHFNEQMLGTAVAHHADTVFLAEAFCGHGFHRDDPASGCYRGPGTPLWFDPTTCTHPNTAGHDALAKLFMDVVNE
jgi:hypothetical protein